MKRARLRERIGEQFSRGIGNAEIGLDRVRLAAAGDDLVRRAPQIGGIDIMENDAGTKTGKGTGDAGADAPPGAGDERALSLEKAVSEDTAGHG